MAFGDNAIWTSQDGQSWTLAGTRGITPRQSNDTINVVTNTPDGFLAAGYETTSAGSQAVTWTSRDGVTWQRLTAAQLGLQEPAGTPSGIDFAVSHGNATVITDRGAGVWLSTDSGAHWTPVTIPVDHGAQNAISGVSFDGAGLIAGPARPHRERRQRRGRLLLRGRPDLAVRRHDRRGGRLEPGRGQGQRLRLRGGRPHQGPVRGLHQHRHRHEMAADRAARQHVQRAGLHPGGRTGRHASSRQAAPTPPAPTSRACSSGPVPAGTRSPSR